MQLASIRVSFPVFRYESVVHHYTPRRPTVLERQLLRVHNRLVGDHTYGQVSLARIFEDVLGLPEPDALVQPALEQLLMLQVIQCGTDISTLRKIGVRDLERTALGEHILRDDLLPATPVDNLVNHLYDPIRGVLFDEKKGPTLQRESQPIAISPELFQNAYPAALIAAAVPGEDHSWWHPNSVISRVQRRRTQELWHDEPGSVDLSDQGKLSVQFQDDALTAYVNGLSANLLEERILRPVLTGAHKPAWLEHLSGADFQALRPAFGDCFPVTELANRLTWSRGVHLVKSVPGLVEVPEPAPSGTVIIVFDDPDARLAGEVMWNQEEDAAIVRLPDPFPAPGIMYYDGKGCCMGASQFELEVGNTRRPVPLGYGQKEDAIPEGVRQALSQVEQKVRDLGDLRDLAITALWRPLSEVWEEIFEAADRGPGDFPAVAERLLTCRRRVHSLTGNKGVPGWDERICGLFLGRIARDLAPVRVDSLAPAIAALAQCQVSDQAELSQVDVIVERIDPPNTIEEIEAVFGLLDPIGGVGHVPFPSTLYTDNVLIDYANRLTGNDLMSYLKGRNPLEQALLKLRQTHDRLCDVLGVRSLSDLDLSMQDQALLAKVEATDVVSTREQWLQGWDQLCTAGQDLSEILRDTTLSKIHRFVQGLAQQLESRLTPETMQPHDITDPGADGTAQDTEDR